MLRFETLSGVSRGGASGGPSGAQMTGRLSSECGAVLDAFRCPRPPLPRSQRGRSRHGHSRAAGAGIGVLIELAESDPDVAPLA